MRNLDFSSWQALLSTLVGLVLISVVAVGVRLLVMQTVQQRRERDNRQINERLRTLIAAYKTLGGSFTGNLEVDPSHLRDLRRRAESAVGTSAAEAASVATSTIAAVELSGSDRARRIRDAVEAALSDIILLGTEQQVELAARAASELASGRPVHTAELVISLRDFIRKVLDLEPVPTHVSIPKQGPARPAASGGKGEGKKQDGGNQGGGKSGGGDGGMGGGGMGFGGGVHANDDDESHH
jgi:heme exporter protein D